MRLTRFERSGHVRLGAIVDGHVVDLCASAPELPGDIEGLLEAGDDAMDQARTAAGIGERIPLRDVRLLAPLTRPRKFLGLGLNYRSHWEEAEAKGMRIPDPSNQLWFNKQVTSIVGPGEAIHIPASSGQVDYEGELAVVIGRRCRHVSATDAGQVIAGYMVCNDVSVRDWQLKSPTATLGKSFDTHGPIGPWLTTPDEIADSGNLAIRTWVDGELRQDGNTNEMVNGVAEMIAYLTSVFTLEPGDILTTGSPRGVGAGFDPPRYLTPGQTVRIEIEGLGILENPVVAEPLSETTFID